MDRVSDWADPQPSSIKKDVGCLLPDVRTAPDIVRATYEDRIDCPSRELGLIIPSASTAGGFRFDLGPKPGLPPLVVAASVLDFLARSESVSRTVNLGSGSYGSRLPRTRVQVDRGGCPCSARRGRQRLPRSSGSSRQPAYPSYDRNEASRGRPNFWDHYRQLLGVTFPSEHGTPSTRFCPTHSESRALHDQA